MSFNENSAQPDRISGQSEIPEVANPQSAIDVVDTQAGNDEHERGAAGGLPWYVANKFGWVKNKTGPGRHLAPHPSYVVDVMNYGIKVAAKFIPTDEATRKASEEFELALAEVDLTRKLIANRDAFDTNDETLEISKEAADVLRSIRNRAVMAYRIAGEAAVDNLYAIEYAKQMEWDVNNTTGSKRFTDRTETALKWGRIAGYYQMVMNGLVSEFNAAGFDDDLTPAVRQQLFSVGRDTKQWLERPNPVNAPVTGEPTADRKAAEDLLGL
jgi:hypothetical protein